jgi:hypothetical protein
MATKILRMEMLERALDVHARAPFLFRKVQI